MLTEEDGPGVAVPVRVEHVVALAEGAPGLRLPVEMVDGCLRPVQLIAC